MAIDPNDLTPTILPPDPNPKKPRLTLPPLACDSHFHVFGPADKYSYGTDILETLAQRVMVGDGAMGTQLYERGVLYSACFEELNVSRPELVGKVHEDYLRSGAQVIETNTFGANAMRTWQLSRMALFSPYALEI